MIMKINNKNNAVLIKRSPFLAGTINTPSDKSISHRCLILGALCIGETKIQNLLSSEDIRATIYALREFGAKIIEDKEKNLVTVHGVGIGGLFQPKKNIYLGNSGTSARLLMGLISSNPVEVEFEGDKSLSTRPMGRVIEPLSEMGLEILNGNSGKLPIRLRGSSLPIPINHKLKVPSAQVKSALMFSALNIKGKSIITEPIRTRDHTERLFKLFGANINIIKNNDGQNIIEIIGEKKLSPQELDIPGDPSSAAFLIVAGLIASKSKLFINNIMLNPTRSLFIDYLIKMGGNIEFKKKYIKCGEEVCDIEVTSSKLKAIKIPKEVAPSLIDEYLILSVAAAYAKGESRFCGLSELRVKESNRFNAIQDLLNQSGVSCREEGDDLLIKSNEIVLGGSNIRTNLDHRVAMAAMILGLNAKNEINIDDISPISTSFPNFEEIYSKIGGVYKYI
jgi:3-phosphoshikimate 1-carboxyvinyltransferase